VGAIPKKMAGDGARNHVRVHDLRVEIPEKVAHADKIREKLMY